MYLSAGCVDICDCRWEERKGWKILIQSFLQAFDSMDNVCLVLLTNAYHSLDNFEHLVEEFALTLAPRATWPRIKILAPGLAQEDLPSLYKAASVFVLPSRGEGWGRPHVEAMSMGLPIIATDWYCPLHLRNFG